MAGPGLLSPLSDDQLEAVAAQLQARTTGTGVKRDLVKWALEIILAVVVAWGTVNTRVSVLESRFNDMKADLTEIRQDVKTLLSRGVVR